MQNRASGASRVCLLSFSAVFSRVTSTTEWLRVPFLLTAKCESLVWIDHVLPSHPVTGFCVVSTFSPLRLKLLWTLVHRF